MFGQTFQTLPWKAKNLIMSSYRPPKFANRLLSFFLKGSEGIEKLGDLEEGFWIKAEEDGIGKARLWYWWQVITTIPVSIKNSFIWGGIMFKNYLKIAVRNIKKYKTYSVINILGLAVGMACCFLIVLWVQNELSYNEFHQNKDDLYRVTITSKRGVGISAPYALLPILKNDYPEIIRGTWYAETEASVKYGDKKFNEPAAYCMPDFLQMFTFPFIKGNKETALSSTNSIIITERLAQKYFGNENALGKTFIVADKYDLTVTGIIENVPENSDLQFDMIIRSELLMGPERLTVWSMDFPMYIQTVPNTNINTLSDKIKNLIPAEDSEGNKRFVAGLQPFNEIHLYSLDGTDPITYIYIFSIIAIVVLLIACINFMNLSTAKSVRRAKEIGMRKVIGANRKDIIKQFFGESIMMAIIALLLSIVIVYLLLPYFNSIAERQLTLNPVENVFIVGAMFVITLFTGIISGIYPAVYLSRFQPVTVLKNTIQKTGKRHLMRRSLIVFQFTAAVSLIICTSIILKQMDYIYHKDLGFDREQILTIKTTPEVRENYETLKTRLLSDPKISNVTSASSLPLRITNGNPVYWEGRTSEDYESCFFVCVDYDYFETFDMKMKYGRSFSKEFPSDMDNYIINESAQKMAGYEDPIGRMFSMWTKEGSIIGVVQNFNALSLHNEIYPIVFVLYKNLTKKYTFIKIKPADIPETIEHVKETFASVAPNFIFNYQFLDDQFTEMYQTETRLMDLLEYFTILAIFISCLGLLGLASFMAEQRTKEVAIRKVLGASNNNVAAILSREFILLVAVANLIAWPIGYYFMKSWIEDFTFRTDIGLMIFIISGGIAFLVALMAVGFQAYKAALKNPVDSLKQE